MKTREKSKLTVIRREHIEGDGALYKYELQLKERIRGASSGTVYIISAEMTLEDGSTTYAETGEIFYDVGKAIAFFDRMVKNLATPIDLPYIVEDGMR